jgi:ABC-type transporter MlaC component
VGEVFLKVEPVTFLGFEVSEKTSKATSETSIKKFIEKYKKYVAGFYTEEIRKDKAFSSL